MAEFAAANLVDRIQHVGGYGDATILEGSVTPTAGASGDVYIPLRIPAGIRLTDLKITNADLDSNGTPTIACKIGYRPVGTSPTADDDYFLATSSTILQAAAQTDLNFAPITFNQDVDIIITLSASAATFASGAIRALAKGIVKGVK